MNRSVYIRPLVLADALVSYQWRNNPKIWTHTISKPDKYITPEIETEWLANVLSRKNERRFAICRTADDRYLGNIFLTDITETEAELHIFIGETQFWGKGVSTQAGWQCFELGFTELGLECIYVRMDENNRSAIAACERVGMVRKSVYYDSVLGRTVMRMEITRAMFEERNRLMVLNAKQSI